MKTTAAGDGEFYVELTVTTKTEADRVAVRDVLDKWAREHPESHVNTARAMTTDPVTGKMAAKCVNDLGGVYYDKEEFPHARDINKDGKCPLYATLVPDSLPEKL